MVDKAEAEKNYAKEWKKATYSVQEIKENMNTEVKEDLLLAYEKICGICKSLENSADHVKDAMLDAETSLEEVKVWAHVRKEELIPVHELRNKLKQALDNLEKKEIHKREEDWFHKKFELEMAFEEKKAAQKISKAQAVKLQKIYDNTFQGRLKTGFGFGTRLLWKWIAQTSLR